MPVTKDSTIVPTPMVPRFYQIKWGTSLTVPRAFHAIILKNYDCIIEVWYPNTSGLNYQYHNASASKTSVGGSLSPNASVTVSGLTLTCSTPATQTIVLTTNTAATITVMTFQTTSTFVTGDPIRGVDVPTMTLLNDVASVDIHGVHHLMCQGVGGITLIWVPSTNDAPAILHLDHRNGVVRAHAAAGQTTTWSQNDDSSFSGHGIGQGCSAKRIDVNTSRIGFTFRVTGVIFSFAT